MLAAAFLLACTCASPQPVTSNYAYLAQDEHFLYVRDNGLERIDKTTGERHTIAPSPPHLISAIDVDGSRVYYGTTSSILGCSTVNGAERCDDNGETLNSLRVVTITGGEPTVLVDGVRSILAVAHDEAYLYWFEASSRGTAQLNAARSDGRIQRLAKRSGLVDTLVDGLTFPFSKSYLTVVRFDDDAVYTTALPARGIVRISKADGSTRDLVRMPNLTDITAIDDVNLYTDSFFIPKSAGDAYYLTLPLSPQGIPYYNGIVGAGAGRFFLSTFYASGRTTFGTFYGYDPCSGAAVEIGSSNSSSMAIVADSCAVYTESNNFAPQCSPLPSVRITGIDPPVAPVGVTTAVTLTGSGFNPSSFVEIAGQRAAAVQYVSPVQLDVTLFSARSDISFLRVRNADGACTATPFAFVQLTPVKPVRRRSAR